MIVLYKMPNQVNRQKACATPFIVSHGRSLGLTTSHPASHDFLIRYSAACWKPIYYAAMRIRDAQGGRGIPSKTYLKIGCHSMNQMYSKLSALTHTNILP